MAELFELELVEAFEVKNIIKDKIRADRDLLDYTIAYQVKALSELAKKHLMHDSTKLITDVRTQILNIGNHVYPEGVVVITTANVYKKKKV